LTKTFNLKKIAEEFSKKQGLLNISKDLGAVKKDLIKTPSFNVALISLDSGQAIPPHPEPYGVCFYVISGKGEFTVGNEQFQLASGEMIFVKANEVRGILSKEKLALIGVQDAH
jgi:quercetin dioxygenase-like cupin family protein